MTEDHRMLEYIDDNNWHLKATRQDVANFLAELTHLSRKYKIAVCGCGCCDSPYLNDDDTASVYGLYPGDRITYEETHHVEDSLRLLPSV